MFFEKKIETDEQRTQNAISKEKAAAATDEALKKSTAIEIESIKQALLSMSEAKKSAASMETIRARSSSNDFDYYREESSSAQIIRAGVKNSLIKAMPSYTDLYERDNYENVSDEDDDDEEKLHKDDEELRKFEKLEQYVDEHPSFHSSTSFVDTIFQSKSSSNSNYHNHDIEETIEENDENFEMTENGGGDSQQQALMFKMMKEFYDKSNGITDMASYNSRLEQLFKEYENYKPNSPPLNVESSKIEDRAG
jgi:hypothetical protein